MDPFVAREEGGEEREQDGERDGSTRGLTFPEVLHLLTRKAVLGKGIPAEYSSPPWRVPDSVPRQEEVNGLLQQSMRTQAGTVPGAEDFHDFILSNSSLAVSSLLRHYLATIGIASDIVFGVLLWDSAAREGPQDYEGTPHVWLRLREAALPVDNVHVSFPETADNQDYYYQCKQLNSYVEEDPLQSARKLFLGMEEQRDSREVVRHNLQMLHTFSQAQHTLKYLAVSLHHAELNPGVRLYHLLMCQWVASAWGRPVPDLEAEAARACWACGKEAADGAELKTCTECRVARYCHRECQRKEWRVHKLLHKELTTTRELLATNARDEGEDEPEED